MGAVQKPKNRPPRAKKLVFWLVMVLSALLLSLWWWNAAQKRINQFQGKNLWESGELIERSLVIFNQRKDLYEKAVAKIKDKNAKRSG